MSINIPRGRRSGLRCVGVLFALFVALAFSFSLATAQSPPPRSFAELIAEKLKAAVPSAAVEIISNEELKVRRANGSELSVFLNNVYAQYRRDPSLLAAIVDAHVAAIAKPQAPPAGPLHSRIVPVVKDRAWLREFVQAQRDRGGHAVESLSEPLNDELSIVYAEDTPNRTRYLTTQDLPALGVQRKELRALAIANLRKLLTDIRIRSYGGVLSEVVANGDYDASLLLFDELWTNAQMKVEGELIVAVPAKDMVLVAGAKDPRSLKMLREMAAKYAKESPHRLTPTVFVRRDGRFVAFAEK